jgi:hypothetical protein
MIYNEVQLKKLKIHLNQELVQRYTSQTIQKLATEM